MTFRTISKETLVWATLDDFKRYDAGYQDSSLFKEEEAVHSGKSQDGEAASDKPQTSTMVQDSRNNRSHNKMTSILLSTF